MPPALCGSPGPAAGNGPKTAVAAMKFTHRASQIVRPEFRPHAGRKHDLGVSRFP